MGRWRRVPAALLPALLLCACSGVGGGNVETLLRAPQLTGQASAVQRALTGYLGSSANVTFKYPASGDFLSPFLFGDWDGDGAQEAAALYTTADMANVSLAVLEAEGDSGWRVTQTAEGLSGEVESVTTAHLRDADSLQMLVGYGSAQGDRYLVVYNYSAETLQTVISQSYTDMLLTNITGNADTQDLVLALPGEGENAGINLQLLTNTEDGFRSTQTLEIGVGQFTACAALHAGSGQAGPYLVVDGWSGAAASSLFSSFVTYNSETGFLNSWLPDGLDDPYTETVRYDTSLTSRDINGNGAIDIPVEVADGGTLNAPLDRSLRFLLWRDFLSGAARGGVFGVYDSENRFFLPLPRQLRGTVRIRPNAAGSGWLLSGGANDRLLCELRVVDPGDAPADERYRRIANIGSQQLQMREINAYPGLTAESIADSVLLLS